MYTINNQKNNKIILLFLIMAMVSLFTILAYTLYLDSHTYKYNKQVVGTRLALNEEVIDNNVNTENMIENVTSSIVRNLKIKEYRYIDFFRK